MALAQDLLAATPRENAGTPIHATQGGFGEAEATYDAGPAAPPTPSGRVILLSERLSELDPALVRVDDLIARLLELPAKPPADRGLLLDSIELEAQERLNAAKRRRELACFRHRKGVTRTKRP